MEFFLGLLSFLVVIASVCVHPQSFFGVIALVVLCVGGLVYYFDVEAKKQERIAQREQAEENDYLKTQRSMWRSLPPRLNLSLRNARYPVLR